ncbi:MAG: hypothetical protein methR_P0325 [Methyloprofundus sp.]|nr:MAG: hypothetical protein methR_P0325 [Methyloprofundus sp.]
MMNKKVEEYLYESAHYPIFRDAIVIAHRINNGENSERYTGEIFPYLSDDHGHLSKDEEILVCLCTLCRFVDDNSISFNDPEGNDEGTLIVMLSRILTQFFSKELLETLNK